MVSRVMHRPCCSNADGYVVEDAAWEASMRAAALKRQRLGLPPIDGAP